MRDFFSKRSLLVLLCLALPARASPLTLQLPAPRGAEFAGFYLARTLGFYSRAGIDLAIVPAALRDAVPKPGPDLFIASAGPALRAAAQGFALVNVAQIYHESALSLICRRSSRIRSPGDLAGRRIGLWPGPDRAVFLAWFARIGIRDPVVVEIPRRPGLSGVAPLLNERVACQAGRADDEYWTLVGSGLDPGALIRFGLADQGFAPLEDGVWAPAAALADPARRALLLRFLAASLRGWRVALAHPAVAADAALPARSPADARARARQVLGTVLTLVRSPLRPLFYLEPAAYARTLGLLGPPPAPLTAWPAASFTHDLLTQATAMSMKP